MKKILLLLLLFSFYSCYNRPKAIVINSPNNKNKLCLFQYFDDNWSSYTIVTCNCSPIDELEQIMKTGSYLSIRNKGSYEWKFLLKWNNDLPTLYTYAERFQEIRIEESIMQHIRVDTLPKMYYNDKLSSDYFRISQSCTNESDYCWD